MVQVSIEALETKTGKRRERRIGYLSCGSMQGTLEPYSLPSQVIRSIPVSWIWCRIRPRAETLVILRLRSLRKIARLDRLIWTKCLKLPLRRLWEHLGIELCIRVSQTEWPKSSNSSLKRAKEARAQKALSCINERRSYNKGRVDWRIWLLRTIWS